MLKRHFFWRGALVGALLGVCSLGAWAQTTESRGYNSLALPEASVNNGGAAYKELQCGGYIRKSPLPSLGQLVGGEQEQEQYVFSSGDYVYLNIGAQQSVRVGQEFAVIRPRGTVRSKFSRKGALGTFVQEIGQVRVVSVKDRASVALVITACETMLLGDLLTDVPARSAAIPFTPTNFDRFTDPTAKPTGRIVLARDGQEMLSRNQIVYIDLGAEDNLRAGDRLTIYRPVGTGDPVNIREVEVARGATGDFGSDHYKGGKFSNMAQRSKESSNGIYDGRTVNTASVKAKRPPLPRKIVGEMVVLNVQERAATAVITVVAQEIHTGDYVEIK